MKAISLHQPHAHLVGLGAKPFETRDWSTPYRGLLAICAAKPQRDECIGLLDYEQSPANFRAPWSRHLNVDTYKQTVRHGCVSALVFLRDCLPAPKARDGLLARSSEHVPGSAEHMWFEEAAEFGDFTPGRWAWELELLCNYEAGGADLIPIKGQQGIWTVPESTVAAICETFLCIQGEMICRVCGCTDSNACPGGCSWAADYLCTSCVGKEARAASTTTHHSTLNSPAE